MLGMNKTRKMAYLTLFIALEIVMSIVPFLGYIPLGVINATTLHIPVILAGMIISKKEGAIVGLVFGITSLLKNTFEPNPTSFLFSPFYSLNGTSGNIMSIFIAIVPRVLCGYMAGLIYEKIKVKGNLRIMIASGIGAFINTALVMGMAYLFFKDAYALATGNEVNIIFKVILGVVATNGVAEMIVAMIFSLIVMKVAAKVIVRD